MKRMQAVSLLVLGLLSVTGNRAAAEYKTSFQPGMNISYEGGGNSFLWGTIGSHSLAPGDYSWNPYPAPKDERHAAKNMYGHSYAGGYGPAHGEVMPPSPDYAHMPLPGTPYPPVNPPGPLAPSPAPAAGPEANTPPVASARPTVSTSYYPRQQPATGYNYPGYYYPSYPGYAYPGYYQPYYNQNYWYGR
jgi:hypothetical protein